MTDDRSDYEVHDREHWGRSNEYPECIFCVIKRRQWEHESICYGYPNCSSCGCSKGEPCVYHKGSPRYANELKERQVAALEAMATRRREAP